MMDVAEIMRGLRDWAKANRADRREWLQRTYGVTTRRELKALLKAVERNPVLEATFRRDQVEDLIQIVHADEFVHADGTTLKELRQRAGSTRQRQAATSPGKPWKPDREPSQRDKIRAEDARLKVEGVKPAWRRHEQVAANLGIEGDATISNAIYRPKKNPSSK